MENPLRLLAAQLSITMGDGWRKQLIPLRKEKEGGKKNHLKCLKSISACLSALKGGGGHAEEFRENIIGRESKHC